MPPNVLMVSLLALNDQMCKFPVGPETGARQLFCGHRNFNGLIYCEYHGRLAYEPESQRPRPSRSIGWQR